MYQTMTKYFKMLISIAANETIIPFSMFSVDLVQIA